MGDLISRQAAIDALEWKWAGKAAIDAVKNLPSAQPEPCEDAVSRKDVVKFLDDWMSALNANCHHQSMADLKIIKNDFENLPSAQPEPEIIACGDCKHYICHDRRCGYWNHGVKPLEWCCHGEERNG